MIHLKLRQAAECVNYKRVERLYRLEQLHIRRRRRKKIPVTDRQPLIRPGRANEVWSMDFAFDRIASGRTIKCLVIVDDATHEAVAIVPEHTRRAVEAFGAPPTALGCHPPRRREVRFLLTTCPSKLRVT